MDINLLFDMNFQVHRWAHVIRGKKDNFLELEDERINLIKTVLHNISFEVNTYKEVLSNSFFVFDSPLKSFRNEILKGEYKANRKARSNEFNRDGFKIVHEAIYQILSQRFNCIKIDYAEADDIIYLLSRAFLAIGKSSIIISSDSDLRQLIRQNDKAFVCMYDIFQKRYLIDKYIQPPPSDDGFGGMFTDESSVKDHKIKELVWNINEKSTFIDPVKSLFCKILSGDAKSDNIPSSFYYEKGKSKTVTSYTDGRAETLYNSDAMFKSFEYIASMFDEKVRRNLAIQMVAAVCKDDAKVEEACRGVLRNMKLIWLHNDCYPEDFKQSLIVSLNSFMKRLNYHNFATTSINDTLMGTIFEYNRAISYDDRKPVY